VRIRSAPLAIGGPKPGRMPDKRSATQNLTDVKISKIGLGLAVVDMDPPPNRVVSFLGRKEPIMCNISGRTRVDNF